MYIYMYACTCYIKTLRVWLHANFIPKGGLKFCSDYSWNMSFGAKYEIAREESEKNQDGAENASPISLFQPGLKFRFDYMGFFSDISARLPGMKILYRFFKLLARAEVIRHFYFFWIYAVIIYDLNIFFILLLLFILVNLVWNRRENYKKIVLTQFPLSREIRHVRLVRMRNSACGELRESVMVF